MKDTQKSSGTNLSGCSHIEGDNQCIFMCAKNIGAKIIGAEDKGAQISMANDVIIP